MGSTLKGLAAWLVAYLGLNGPLRQYFSLCMAVSQRKRKKKDFWREENVKTAPSAPTASAVGPRPTIVQISRSPRHWNLISTIASRDHPRSSKRGFYWLKQHTHTRAKWQRNANRNRSSDWPKRKMRINAIIRDFMQPFETRFARAWNTNYLWCGCLSPLH